MLGCHAVDHLLDEDGLADTGTTEQSDLAALQVRGDEIEHLDARLEHLLLWLHVLERRRLTVNRPGFARLDAVHVERGTPHVEDVTQRLVADRYRDRGAGVADLGSTHQTISGRHGNGADTAVAEVLGGLGEHGPGVVAQGQVDLEREQDLGQTLRRELDIDHRPSDLGDPSNTDCFCHGSCSLVLGEGLGAADDLRDLRGDLGLAGAVGDIGEDPDELLGVVGCRLHCPAAG